MTAGHRAYVSSIGRGNGRYSYTYKCTCGALGGNYSSRAGAETAAKDHEKNPSRKPTTRVTAR